MAQIVKVRTEPGWGGSNHSHITEVELADGSREARSTVISNIRFFGKRYWTEGGGERASVVVRGCPFCPASDYITTMPDTTTANNLLKLPRL